MQVFAGGHLSVIDPARPPAPSVWPKSAICFADAGNKFRVNLEGSTVYIVGLQPLRTYQVEVDDEEMYEAESDSGGILEVQVPPSREVGVRLR